jgi:cytochrome c553
MNVRFLSVTMALLLGAITGGLIAGPSSNVAWDVETLRAIKGGKPELGKDKAAACAGCHGAEGVAMNPTYPSMGGQRADYTYKQLRDYKDGTRANALMAAFAQSLSEEDMLDIAAFYAEQPLPPAKPAETSLPLAEKLVHLGDGPRLVPACHSCHGTAGEGKMHGIPALAGQNALYFKQTMEAYASGARANDVYSVMRSIAKELTPEEIEELAEYYAGLE